MKKLFIIVACAALCVSCSTLRKSSTHTLDVATSLTSEGSAELIVSPTKIYYNYLPTKQDRKTGLKNVVNNAVSDALREHKADVLVHMQYDAVIKGKHKVKRVTVSGYPATYKNFK